MKNPIHFGTDLRVKLSYKCFPFFSLSGCHVLTIENCRVEFLPHLEKNAPTLLNEYKAVLGSYKAARAHSLLWL